MKSIFVCNNKSTITDVYSDESIKTLINIADICSDVFSYSDIIANPNKFAETEYIFSTWGMPKFSEEEIEAIFPSLKCIFYAAGTVQAFAHPFINRGIKVFSAWAANAVPVAEYTVAQIILANKGFYKAARLASKGEYDSARDVFENYSGNYNVKIGIIGAGMIGKLVIKMLKSYKLDVLVFDPFLPDDAAKELGVKKCELLELFSECAVVSNHLADNAKTKGMLNGVLFEVMRPYSTFINTGRGAQVVEDELIEVLKKRPDITALLDVTWPEPPAADSEFYTLDNCILTTHIAGSSANEVHRMSEYMLAEFDNYINGRQTKYEVTSKMLETMA